MEKQDLEYFKQKLLDEKARLESELSNIGRINPENKRDWEPIPPIDDKADDSDPNDRADNIEDYENNAALLKPLEIELNEVKHALEKFENGTYGICEVDGHPIERERLEANPSARTCLKREAEQQQNN